MLSREELPSHKVQKLPDYARWVIFAGSAASGRTCWVYLTAAVHTAGSNLAVVSVGLLLFSVFGFRRTLETVSDHLSGELVDLALASIGSVIESAIDCCPAGCLLAKA